jgi:hypothetical protein
MERHDERYKKVSPGDSYVLMVDGKRKRITNTEKSARAINRVRKDVVNNKKILSIEERLAKRLFSKPVSLNPKMRTIHNRRLKILKKSQIDTYPTMKLPGVFW